MKKNHFFLVLFLILFQGYLSSSLLAMQEPTPDRRLEAYPSPEAYLDSFKGEGKNKGKAKILFIGAGLTYDDLVNGSELQFIHDVKVTEKTRTKYYPLNAYLIDLDGNFFYHSSLHSHSDYQANIAIGIGDEKRSLPKEFIGQFDFIILENLEEASMTGEAFENLYSLLKTGGKIICNFELQIKIVDMNWLHTEEQRKGRALSLILDTQNNAILQLCFPPKWIEKHESFLQEVIYISPILDKEDEVYKGLEEQHQNMINFISFE